MADLFKKYKEIILYVFFGALTTGVNYGVYYLLAHPFGWDVLPSNLIAWAAGVLFAFVTNKLYVFESKDLSFQVVAREFLTFTAARIFSGILDTIIMVVFVDVLGFNDLWIKILSNIVVIIVNYILSKLFIFRSGKSDSK